MACPTIAMENYLMSSGRMFFPSARLIGRLVPTYQGFMTAGYETKMKMKMKPCGAGTTGILPVDGATVTLCVGGVGLNVDNA